jgi:hypothetical protein
MKRIWSAPILYAVSLAVFIFQFIIPGYSDLLFYMQVGLHAALWAVIFYLTRRAVQSRTLVIVLTVIAALLFSLAPFDIMIPSLFDQFAGQVWLTFVLRFAIHLTCLVAMVIIVKSDEGSR